jgi:ATP diphosphatase
MKPGNDIRSLLEIMASLRTPGTGCPWDLQQDFSTIAPYTIEEAYEVADAIERGDLADLRDELGDLLLQVVFHSRLAEEAGAFAFADVVEAITTKMIRRHPHVFAGADADTPAKVKERWEAIKAEEKSKRRRDANPGGILDDVPLSAPALTRAVALQKRAGSVGFDWNDPRAVLAKMREEIGELEHELDAGDRQRLGEELGDILFAAANLARHLKVDPEAALRATNAKFVKRFKYIEAALQSRGQPLAKATLDEMEALWNEAKTRA